MHVRLISLVLPLNLALAPALAQAQAQAQATTPQAPRPSENLAKSKPIIRAQYAWGYSGMDGEGSGTLSILVDPTSSRVVLELHGLGERLVFLSGDAASGYHVQIPRQGIDQTASSLGALPIPFLPALGSTDGLYRLLTEGQGPGVKVRKKDALGPVKLRYSGVDEHGKDVMVWLDRQRWE